MNRQQRYRETYTAEQTNRRFARLVGRGTTALFVALRGLALTHGWQSGEIIVPDIICSTVLDAVLLAGFLPVMADITRDRLELSVESVRKKITPQTRAIITAHVFGLVSNVEALREFNLPIIEDAVQGLGGRTESGAQVGTLGDISIISFDSTKMIGGRGGVILTDDPALNDAIEQVELSPVAPDDEPPVYAHYRRQLAPLMSSLLTPFNNNDDNWQQISRGWQQLSENVAARNEKAAWYADQLANMPLDLPAIHPTDAVWRYTVAAKTRPQTSRILRGLQLARLPGSHLYPALSSIYAPDPTMVSAEIAPRLVNLWVNAEATPEIMSRTVEVIRHAVSLHG